jgi:predicted DNA binding protein
MKIERIQISNEMMRTLGYGEFFNYITQLELMNTFQYDQNNFFALERVVFKPEAMKDWENVMKTKLLVEFVQPLSITDNTVICIAKSTNKGGFIPMLQRPGFWALMPPVVLTSESITTTIICEDAYLTELHDLIEKFDPDFKILAISDLTKALAFDQVLLPHFTERQREIAQFAVKMGYYEIPKKTSAEDIAKQLNISVSGLNAHLRKIEARIMDYFFS